MSDRYVVMKADAGKGAFGIVKKALDTDLERHVAIKTLNPIFKVSPSEEDIERFRREAKTLAALSHPNVPAVYDVSSTMRTRFLRSSQSGSKAPTSGGI